MRRLLALAVCLGGLLIWQVWESVRTEASAIEAHAFDCDMGGVWRLGGSALVTVTPTDTTHRNFSIAVYLHEDPTIGGMFGDAVARTSFVGPVRKIGRDLFEFTAEALGQNAVGQMVYRETISGEMLLTSCDTLVSRSMTTFLLPDGSEPLCVPFVATFERMEMEPPCRELPPFPE